MGGDGHGEPAALAAAQQARFGQLVNHVLRAPGGNRGIIQRLFHRGAIDVAEEDIRIGRVENAGLHRPAQQGFRVVDQVSIHRLIAGDEYYERALPAAAGAPGLLPKARDGPRETCRDHGIEPTDIDTQLEGGGGGDAEQGGIVKRALQRAAVLGQVTGAVGGDALGKIGPAEATGEHLGRAHGHHLGRAARTHKGHGARALGDEGGHHLGRLGGGGATHRRPMLSLGPLDKAWFPQRHGARAGGSGVLRNRAGGPAGKALRMPARVLHSGRGINYRRPRAIVRAQAQQPAQHERHVRAEYAPVGMAFIDNDEL